MWLLALAIAPGIAISLYIYVKDQYNREPHLNLIVSFILGMISTVPAIIFQLAITPQIENFFPKTDVAYTILLSFMVVAVSEEYSKFFMLRYYAYHKKSFDEPFDGIVYGVLVSMGFATLENIGYVFEHGAGTGIVRMFLSVPAHASFGALMGYYVGKAKFNEARKSILLIKGFLIAVFFHGAFDCALLLQDNKLVTHYISQGMLLLIAIAVFVIAFKMARLAIREHENISRNQNKSYNNDSFS